MDQGAMIDDFQALAERLSLAMRGGNLATIEDATVAFRTGVEKLRAASGWTPDPVLREKLTGLRPELDQSRNLAHLLADMTGQMHDLVAARTQDGRQPVYSRKGDRMA